MFSDSYICLFSCHADGLKGEPPAEEVLEADQDFYADLKELLGAVFASEGHDRQRYATVAMVCVCVCGDVSPHFCFFRLHRSNPSFRTCASCALGDSQHSVLSEHLLDSLCDVCIGP